MGKISLGWSQHSEDLLPTGCPVYFRYVHISVPISTHTPVQISVHMPIQHLFHMSVYKSVHMSVQLSINMSVHLSVYKSVHISVHMSSHMTLSRSVAVLSIFPTPLSSNEPSQLHQQERLACVLLIHYTVLQVSYLFHILQ